MQNNFFHPKFIPTWILLLLMRIVALLPITLHKILAYPIALLLRKLAKDKYKTAYINIGKCFPHLSKAEQKKIVDRHFFDFALSLFETANCFYKNPQRLKKSYVIKNLDIVKNLGKDEKNVILLSGHFTPMLLVSRMLADNLNYAGVYRPQNNQLFNHTMVSRFSKYGIDMIDTRDSRAIIKTIKSGIPTFYAPDQDFRIKDAVFADFFGVQANTLTATSKLAKFCNATLVHFDFYRDKEDKYIIDFKIVDNFPTGDDLVDANKVNKTLEHQILKATSQYLWTHKRFKSRPKGEKSFYN